MKLLLVYPPFCNPSTFPYSISYLKGFVKANSRIDVKCLDLNAKFHRQYFDYENSWSAENLEDFTKLSIALYKKNHELIISDKKPFLFDKMLQLILKENPDYVGFSLVYNSQCFYIHPLAEELEKRGIKCIAGGPAVNEKVAVPCLANEFELLEFLEGKKQSYTNAIPDFSDYDEKDYLAKEIILPLKSSSGCYYKRCAFCTHHSNKNYFEADLNLVKQSIISSGKKYFFFIDDMISKKRLMEIAQMVKELKIKWWCQLRPTKELIGAMKTLRDSGLSAVCWGVESGSQKILDRMRKGTSVSDIKKVLEESASAGIKNTVFIMFGFPGETKEDFLQTISFLKENADSIHLVSTTVFGLQKGSFVYENPEEYGITKINKEKRTRLGEKITYEVKEGMGREEAISLRKKYTRSIKKIDKLPRVFNYFREQVLFNE